MPKHKPWERNRDFYPAEESDKATSRGGKTADSVDTMRDNYVSNQTHGEETAEKKPGFFNRLFVKILN